VKNIGESWNLTQRYLAAADVFSVFISDSINDTSYQRNSYSIRCSAQPAGWPKKVSHYQIMKKFCQIVLKSAYDIIFLRQIKEMIKHYNIIRRY